MATPRPTTVRFSDATLADLDLLVEDLAQRRAHEVKRSRGPTGVSRGDVLRRLIAREARQVRARRDRARQGGNSPPEAGMNGQT